MRRRVAVADDAVDLPLSLREPCADDYLTRADRASVAVAGLTHEVRERIEVRWDSERDTWLTGRPLSAATRDVLLDVKPEWLHRDGALVRRLRPWTPTRPA